MGLGRIMASPGRTRSERLLLALLGVGYLAWIGFLVVRPDLGWGGLVLRASAAASAIALAWVAGQRSRDCPSNGIHCQTWALFALGSSMWAIGELLLAWHQRRALPQSVMEGAHLACVAAFVPTTLGALLLVFSAPLAGRFRRLLDSAILAAGATMVSWHYVLGPALGVPKETWVKSAIFLGYPMGAALTIAIALIAAFGHVAPRSWRVPLGLLLLGIGIRSAGALLRSASWVGIVSPEVPWMEALWPLGACLLMASAIFWPEEPIELASPMEELRKRTSRSRAILVLAAPHAVALATFGLIASLELASRGYVSPGVFYFGCAITGLVVLRQILTLVENAQLSQRVARFNVDLEAVIETRTSQLHALYELSRSVGNSLQLDDVLDSTSRLAREALRGDAIVINLTPFALTPHANVGCLVRHEGLDGMEWALDHLDILETPWHGRHGTFHDKGFLSHARYVIAPILCKQQPLGWIAILRREEPFEETAVDVLGGIGIEVGTALENARLYHIARLMADVDSVTGLLNHRAAQQRFEAAFAAARRQREPLSVLMLDVNNFKHFNDTYGHMAGDTVLKQIAQLIRETSRPHDVLARYGGDEFLVLLPNTDPDQAARFVDELRERVGRVGFAEPGTDRVIPYTISVGQATYPHDTEKRQSLIEAADRQMYVAKRAGQGSKPAVGRGARPTERTESYDLLEAMVIAVDNKDLYTRAHSEEVAEYALWIAQELALSEDACKTIRKAALLHDVGKIGIPDSILSKPGKLLDDEIEIMRQHPVVGALIVSAIPEARDIIPGVRHHHERWDGDGYPDRLRGESIPLLGRILAVADGFSALTTDRPYRKGMPWHQALEQIRVETGRQYDPAIVDAFVRAVGQRMDGGRGQPAA